MEILECPHGDMFYLDSYGRVIACDFGSKHTRCANCEHRNERREVKPK
jgi:hypothetical protein